MASLIPQSFLDDLIDRVDIVDLVDQRVKLKKTGKNYSACCPFHDEKSPSFTVSPDKQFYYCFGCGASGNSLGFVMEYDRVGFLEAVELLAREAGVEVPREARDPAAEAREKERDQLIKVLEKSASFYQLQLRQHASKTVAVNYLLGRGLDGVTARDYGVGYAPPGWNNAMAALESAGVERKLLVRSGLVIDNLEQKSQYDRFRNRIVFPIRDIRGRYIGFGGRVLDDSKPKYLNSPETPVFHKSQELYGLYEARKHYRELPRLLVVEGYMDVVSLAQFGIRYGVATMGTACGEDHLKRAFRYTDEVVFCFDGDNAGRKAALRALENALPVMEDGKRVKFLFLPDGEDPDTLVRQVGQEKFEALVTSAEPLEDYLFTAASEGIDDIQSLEGRTRMSRAAAPMLDRLPKGIFKELMLEQLAARTGINRATLDEVAALEKQKRTRPPERKPEVRAQGPNASLSPALNPNLNPSLSSGPAQVASAESKPIVAAVESYPEVSGGQGDYGYDYPELNGAEPVHDDAGYGVVESSGRYKLSLEEKAIGLILAEPAIVSQVEELGADWAESDHADLKLLGHLLELMHERPHYQRSHLLGLWRARYGEAETERLNAFASHDFMRATKSLAPDAEDAEQGYDRAQALRDVLAKLREREREQQAQLSRQKLKSLDFASSSKEEVAKLVREALEAKKTVKQGQ